MRVCLLEMRLLVCLYKTALRRMIIEYFVIAVFGGDTKLDERDVLDETLYLLNTCKVYPLGRILKFES